MSEFKVHVNADGHVTGFTSGETGDRSQLVFAPVDLRPAPGACLAPEPWTCNDEGVINDAEGHVVCVLGAPFEGVTEQDVTNSAAIVALPELIEAAIGALNALLDEDEVPTASSTAGALQAALHKAGAL